MIKNLITNRRGTALLVALLVMGVLIAVSLVLSSLIFREVRITHDVIDAGKAYYAAESGVEVALFELDNNLAGWGTEKDDEGSPQYQALKLDTEFDSVGEYRVDNSCKSYPCFDEDIDKTGAPISAYYNYLDLNESVTIPLFVVENGVEVPVREFTVQFYAAFDLDDLKIDEGGNKLSGWDILRWKLFGIYDGDDAIPGKVVTETISDFTAISTQRQKQLPGTLNVDDFVNGEIPDFGNLPTNPSWFGTVSCTGQEGRDTDAITCNPYEDPYFESAHFSNKFYESATDGQEEEIQQGGYESGVVVGQCGNTQAREVYVYGGDGKVDPGDIYPCYEIGDFLDTHRLSYLVLTNLMNPAVLDTTDPVKKDILSRLYYRVEVFADPNDAESGDEVVREYASIKANGYSGDIKQSIDVQMKQGSYMPVFNFTLYSTYKSSCEEWYIDCPGEE